MALIIKILVSMCFLWHMTGTHGLDLSDLPIIACPELFRYQQVEEKIIGNLTLRNVPFNTLTVEMKFSQKEPIVKRFRGSLSFEPDLTTVQKNFEDGSPITLKVTFPLATEVPKLIRITMNNKAICSADIPDEHDVIYSLQRSFTPTEGTHRKLNNTTPSATTTTEKTSQETIDSIVCGISSFNPTNISVGEHNIKWGWFPWAVRIYRLKTFTVICSGVLISARTVVTTVHYFDDFDTGDDILVHLGALGLTDVVDSYPVLRRVKTLLKHPEYGSTTYSGADIALLQLDIPISFSRYILPICLWNDLENAESIVGEMAYAAYFGSDGFDQVMRTTIISQSQCLQSSRGYIQTISPRTLCANYYNASSGPRNVYHTGTGLIMNRDGLWKLRGLYSTCLRVDGKCKKDLYFVYSDVAKYNTWIRENIWI